MSNPEGPVKSEEPASDDSQKTQLNDYDSDDERKALAARIAAGTSDERKALAARIAAGTSVIPLPPKAPAGADDSKIACVECGRAVDCGDIDENDDDDDGWDKSQFDPCRCKRCGEWPLCDAFCEDKHHQSGCALADPIYRSQKKKKSQPTWANRLRKRMRIA
jgi:hypothetical protein